MEGPENERQPMRDNGSSQPRRQQLYNSFPDTRYLRSVEGVLRIVSLVRTQHCMCIDIASYRDIRITHPFDLRPISAYCCDGDYFVCVWGSRWNILHFCWCVLRDLREFGVHRGGICSRNIHPPCCGK